MLRELGWRREGAARSARAERGPGRVVVEGLESRRLLSGALFDASRSFDVGIQPASVTVGDFNGDGKSDLATANEGSGTVSIRLGKGDGTFHTKTDYGVGGWPLSVTVGDFNGDGKSDLAVANYNSGSVSILLGKSDGTFQTKTDYGVGSEPCSVAVGDFNGDGKSDLAVANVGDTVSILLGKGDGTFQSKTGYGGGSAPYSVTVGDFNGDGKSDLAVANVGDTVSILLGKGDGTFQTKTDYGVGSEPWSVAVGDFNGDGKSDLATANYGSNTVSVLLNTTTFANRAPTDIALSASSIAENQPVGTTVGNLSSTDPDPGDTFTYSLVSGTGGTDNASFTISGNQLRTNAVFNYAAKSSYSIRVRTTDSGGLFYEKVFTISVTDAIAPTITSVKINDGNAQRSMVNKVVVTFSEAVTLAGGALGVVKRNGVVVPNVTVMAGNPSGDQKTWELTFSGSGAVGGSLPDGMYKVVVSAAGVSDLAGNHTVGDYSQKFHRLFGDVDGDRDVDAKDLAAFKQALSRPTSYVWWLDMTGDKKIDNADYLSFGCGCCARS